jgi:hypothetical protein
VRVPAGRFADAARYPSVSDRCHNRPDLVVVIEAWPELPEAIKAGILAMVKAARSCELTPRAGSDHTLEHETTSGILSGPLFPLTGAYL